MNALTRSLDHAPLARHRLFETADFDEARDEVARVFCPHKLVPLGPKIASTLHNRVGLEGMSLNYMRYGASIRIDPGELEHFYLLQIPLAGHAAVRCGSQQAVGSIEAATLLSPALAVAMDWSGDCEKLLVQIDRTRVERTLEAILGSPLGRPLDFDVAFPRDGTRDRIIRLVQLLQEDIDAGGVLSGSAVGSQMAGTLIMALLHGQGHNYSQAMGAPIPSIAPRHVKRAEAYMRAHLTEPMTLADIAGDAGVSIRALQEGFRRFRDTTPMELLQRLRLEAARTGLLAAQPHETVTDIALRWGFPHLSRFAASYRRLYQESPSQTLRRGAAP